MGKAKNQSESKNLISRELYKKIKRFDRQEMEEFCRQLFEDGFREGAKASTEADIITTVIDRLQGKKGFGDKTIANIKKALES